MKRVLSIFTIIFLVVGQPASAEVLGFNDAEVKAIGQPVLDNILEGFDNNDYLIYVRDFDDTLRESVSEDQFYQVDQHFEKTIGPIVSKTYLGYLKQGQMTVLLWKARFEYSDNDVLIKLVMSKRGDRYVVTGLWFQ
ncbi:MAG: hypothetical protein K8S27_00280 [Candidatus Omnitrophica bacterium]|nr:hypothetical protein [Candidatus Omnitrophota bacterium]